MKEQGLAVIRYVILPDAKVKKYKDKIRNAVRKQQGNNLNEMLKTLNEIIRGFGNYFNIGNGEKKFQRLDEWMRMRVRAFIWGKNLRCQTSRFQTKYWNLPEWSF
ncbi:group II intron maturase-specific domain-containing protein [Paenibacillus sonchi]|uniref:group II intron maturase-specific domain-containing protein n=1 Tax=Paenibacillus sonchi TaxID=373687 RepID=UPI001E3A055F|nr:group II intron maturase-specific domain-containing protein [Paenibacillus sonchi]MCE3203658.1 hypothetical protein [Paenibacillus sonchi]